MTIMDNQVRARDIIYGYNCCFLQPSVSALRYLPKSKPKAAPLKSGVQTGGRTEKKTSNISGLKGPIKNRKKC